MEWGSVMIRLIVDSTCDLHPEHMEKYGILMLPLRVLLNGYDYRDKIEIEPEQVYEAMRQGIVPKTSQVSPEDVYQVFQGCCGRGEDFIYLAFSSKLSGTYQIARAVMDEFRQKYPNLRMQIVDSKAGSVATALMALQAVQMIEAGHAFGDIVKQLAFMADHAELIFTVSDIGWLVKGGRLGRFQGVLGSILEIKPILEMKNGLIGVFKKARGSQKALAMMAETLAERIAAFPGQVIGIAHSDNLQGVEKLKSILTEKTGATNFLVSKIGSVLGSHIGIGGLGLCFFSQKPEPYYGEV